MMMVAGPLLRSAVVAAFFILLLLRFSESWIFDSKTWLERIDLAGGGGHVVDGRHLEEDDLYHPDQPSVKTERCDACRIIADRFDNGFRLAESRIPSIYKDSKGQTESKTLHHHHPERDLDEAEVSDIVRHVCARRAFSQVYPITTRKGHNRLAAPGLDTWKTFSMRDANQDDQSPFWEQRMKNHCRFFADGLGGGEIYDMWLRVSAGPVGDPFESFLCYGEGIYSDCLQWIPYEDEWPGGDNGQEEDDQGEDDELPEMVYLRQAWERPSNSA